MAGTTYRLRREKSNPTARSHSYAVGLPSDIGDALHEAGIERFYVEFHEEGVLLRPITMDRNQSLPAWLSNGKERDR